MAVREIALVLILYTCQVTGYSKGPPTSTCFTQYPKHKVPTQTSPSPFVMTFDPPAYRPGQDVTITVSDSTGEDFVGIQLAVRRQTDNTEEIVGRFVDYPLDKTKTFNCFDGYQNMLSHANNNPVANITFVWRPPSDNVGDVTFKATFVRSKRVFWVNTETPLAVDSTSPVMRSVHPESPLKSLTKSINFGNCGETKGCFYYPRSCTGSDCKAAATYKYREATKDFLIELYADVGALGASDGAPWVALGLSDDDKMGNDLTLACTGEVGLMSVQEGYNPGRYNQRLFNRFTSEHEVKHSDGILQCRFVVSETMSVYDIDQAVTDSLKLSYTEWKLKEEHYVFVAWGPSMGDSKVLTYHPEKPASSSSKVDLAAKLIISSSTFHVMVQVHATLMIVAWVLFAGIVTVISRHYRDWMEHSRPCGSALWFQIHRSLAVLVAALTVAGIIVIFTHYGTGVRDMSTPHSTVGFAVVGCVGLQILGGLLRPGLESSWRSFFNVGHRFVGHAAHILAAATMFLAYEINYISSDMRRLGIITLSAWVGVQVFWHLMFEIIKRFRAKSGASNTYSIDNNDLKPHSDEDKNSLDCPHTTTLVTYVLTLMGVCAAAILPIYKY